MANEKILIIDDSPQIRDFLAKQVLPREGYTCVAAPDGRAGLDMIGKEKPDLILTDMQMPRMSGLELLQLLAQYKVDIPVVMMTAHGSEMIAIEAFRLGVKDYIVKPFTVEEVLAVIARALSETRLRREKDVLTRNLAAANQQLERRVQEMAVLARVGQAVSALRDQDVLMKRIVEASVFISSANRGALLLAEGQTMRLCSTTGFSTPLDGSVVQPRSLIASVLQSKKPLLLAGAQINSEPYGRDAPPPQAFMATPIVTQNNALGVLAVDRVQGAPGLQPLDGRAAQSQRPFNENDARLLAAMADYAAISLQNARLFNEAKSNRDKLEAVINHTADGIIVLNARGEVLLVNPAAQTLLGSEVQLNKPLFPSTANNTLIQLMARAAGQNKPVSQEIVGARGKVFNVTISPAPTIGFVAVLHDITMFKELERIRQQREQVEVERLRQTLERYVSPLVLEQIAQQGEEGLAHPEAHEAVVLVADIRGFSPLFTQLPSEVLVNDVLNRYFTAMSAIIERHGGALDKFIGDGILAVFGWPHSSPDDGARALLAAAEMQSGFNRLRAEWEDTLSVHIGLGIGIGHGMVIAGSIGTPQHQDYTLMGDAVAVAMALNEQAHGGEIFCSRSLIDRLSGPIDGIAFDEFPPVRIKGKAEEHEVVLVRAELATAASTQLLQ